MAEIACPGCNLQVPLTQIDQNDATSVCDLCKEVVEYYTQFFAYEEIIACGKELDGAVVSGASIPYIASFSFASKPEIIQASGTHAVRLALGRHFDLPASTFQIAAVVSLPEPRIDLQLPSAIASQLEEDWHTAQPAIDASFGPLKPDGIKVVDSTSVTTANGLWQITGGGIAPTQFVSALVFAISLFLLCLSYQPKSTGIGSISSNEFSEFEGFSSSFLVAAHIALLGGILASNAIRYYLSFWSIEESACFDSIRAWGQRRHRFRWRVKLEWSLRIVGLIVLHMLPLVLVRKGQLFELMLVMFYGSMFAWDIVAKHLISHYGSARNDSRLPELRKAVDSWLTMEGIGVCLAFAFLLVCNFAPTEWKFLMVGGVGVASAIATIVDIRANYVRYRQILFPLLLWAVGVISVFFLV